MSIKTESRAALRELINLLNEVDQRWASEEWNLATAEDVVAAHRSALHMLEGGLIGHFEYSTAHPRFRRIVSPSRKFTGDNSDAIYFDAAVSADYAYVIRGEMAGAVYVSITVEVGTEDGSLGTRTAGVLNQTEFDVDANGLFELYLGGEKQRRNWLGLERDASAVTVRYYFEEEQSAAADASVEPSIIIDCLSDVAPPAPPNDATVSAGIRRVAQFVRSRTLDMPPMASMQQPDFVGLVPNEFPVPVKPGNLGLAAADAAYSMAPFYLQPDEALIISGRWPACIFANVCLWNRFQQTFDYQNRQISLNRKQTGLEADGSFRIVLAHQDPGVQNWLDTEGRPFGLVFWRFMLPEGEIETPVAEVVPFNSLATVNASA